MKVTIYMIPLNKSHFGILIGLVDAGTNNANILFLEVSKNMVKSFEKDLRNSSSGKPKEYFRRR